MFFIKLKLDEDYIRKVLDRTETSTNYMTMKAILYYLNKIIKYGDCIEVGEEADEILEMFDGKLGINALIYLKTCYVEGD